MPFVTGEMEVPGRQTGHRFGELHQHRHQVVLVYETGRGDRQRHLRANAVYPAPGVGRTLAGVAQLGLGLVADALDGAAVALQAIGDDVEPVGVAVAGHHDVAEQQRRCPVTGAVRRMAAQPADVEPDPRAAGHRDRTRERHLDRDLIAELEGRRGTGILDDRRRRAATYRRCGGLCSDAGRRHQAGADGYDAARQPPTEALPARPWSTRANPGPGGGGADRTSSGAAPHRATTETSPAKRSAGQVAATDCPRGRSSGNINDSMCGTP